MIYTFVVTPTKQGDQPRANSAEEEMTNNKSANNDSENDEEEVAMDVEPENEREGEVQASNFWVSCCPHNLNFLCLKANNLDFVIIDNKLGFHDQHINKSGTEDTFIPFSWLQNVVIQAKSPHPPTPKRARRSSRAKESMSRVLQDDNFTGQFGGVS